MPSIELRRASFAALSGAAQSGLPDRHAGVAQRPSRSVSRGYGTTLFWVEVLRRIEHRAHEERQGTLAA
jgi:hypothetical protein